MSAARVYRNGPRAGAAAAMVSANRGLWRGRTMNASCRRAPLPRPSCAAAHSTLVGRVGMTRTVEPSRAAADQSSCMRRMMSSALRFLGAEMRARGVVCKRISTHSEGGVAPLRKPAAEWQGRQPWAPSVPQTKLLGLRPAPLLQSSYRSAAARGAGAARAQSGASDKMHSSATRRRARPVMYFCHTHCSRMSLMPARKTT